MRSCCRSVCFVLLLDSTIPPRVGRAWRPIRREVHFGPRCINRPVFQPFGWSAQGDQAKGSLLGLGVKGVEKAIIATVGEVKSTKKLRSGDLLVEVHSRKQSQQIVNLKTFSNIPITVSPHASLNSSKGVITCGELLNVPTEEILKELQEARKLVNSQTPTPGNSYVSVAKKSFYEPSVQKNPDASAVTCSKPSDSTAKASPPITNLPIPSSPSVVPVSEEALASPDFTDFKVVRNRKKLKKDSPTKTNHSITKAEKIAKFYTTSRREITNPIPIKDNISTRQSTLKPLPTTTSTSVDIELLPMAVLPPLEKILLQSRQSDADAEMSSSLSEEDALEYNMSEDLEDSPAVISPPPPSKPGKANKYKNRYPTTVNLIAFKRSRADFRRIERYSKRTSWKSFVSSITSSISSRELWHNVKKAFGTPTSNPISILCVNGQTISSLKGIANSITSTLANTSNSKNYNREFLNNKMKTEKKKLNFNSRSDYSYNCNFKFQEFQACLSKVHKSSPGPDIISYIMLLHLTTESQTNLLYLFNRIWNEQCFPSSWQEAIIIPIPKPGKDITNPLNYRPIALTSCLCKLLEKMINRRLTHFLETKNLLSPFQSGFRKGRSTLDNILALETDIRLAFLQRKHLVAIYFDIEKAYDRTWRYGILQDLYDSNLRGNLPIFIENFLRLRKFRVRLASEMSDYFIQEEGVPHGSILSVTLFILKINNVLNQLPLSINCYLYVDDLCIFCTGMHMNCIQRQLQTAINNISQWSDNNGFTISASKTAAVHFCRKRNLHLDPELQLNGVSIPFLKEIRFLGVVFDNKLSFLPHVMQLRKKCEKSLNILKVLSTTAWGADRPSMLRIYKATILSKLDYGCQIYGSARKSVLQKLDPIHHAALRICSGAFRTSPVQSLYVDCFEPALNYRRQMLSLHYYFRIKSNTYHPFHNFKLRPFLVRLQEARKSFIPVFFSRVHNILTDLNLLYVHVTIHPKRNFPPWKFFETHVLQPFENLNKSNTADIIYQKIFIEHREHYNSFVPIYTDGSKSADQVSFAVVFPNTIFSFRLHPSCSPLRGTSSLGVTGFTTPRYPSV
ncbi:putative RNA-directed DNA polymerase from transposon X-element [Araneus ventricosus]|uniref:Putative RNA-directed DNA polymerase from transposon X-element n=1 Tax=Araneus ventricosus TaxID=182803 RepID=A0A4Y2X2L0_ARAVE|nr:putative RNA-directed DNA polymerase from transposon X-element [Araneus ventricosus]